jgi:hypothetical protein
MMMDFIWQSDKMEWEHCQFVLFMVTLAFRPLHLAKLAVVLGLPTEISAYINHLQEIIALCGSFLTIKEDIVYLIHQSIKDYLTGQAIDRIFPSGKGQVHHSIFAWSITVLSTRLRRNIYNLEYPGMLIGDINPPKPDPLDPIRYSCIFWADHLCSGNGDSPQYKNALADDNTVFAFFQRRFLRWLESLSLLRRLSNGVLSIRKLLYIVQVCMYINSIV